MGDERTANAVDKVLGQRVRKRRLELEMSQERLAELLGLTFQQVQKYEKGVNRIAASRLWEIATALDMPIGAFFEGLSPRGGKTAKAIDQVRRASAGGAAERVLSTPDGIQLVRLYDTIKSASVRRKLIGLAQALAEGQGK